LIGLEFLTAGMLYLAPTPVVATVECHAKTAPKINITPSKSMVKYDFTKTKPELNTFDVDTISPYGPNHHTYVSGLMSGALQVSHQVGFMHEKYEQVDQGCIYLKSVEVKVHIDPTIYIAKEYPKGSCMHSAVLTHERKHVREDQLIVNKYTNIIGQAVLKLVKSQDAAFGPYEIARLPFVQQNIENSINKVVKKYTDQMNHERQQRQQAIDNLEEYESIGARCPQSEQ